MYIWMLDITHSYGAMEHACEYLKHIGLQLLLIFQNVLHTINLSILINVFSWINEYWYVVKSHTQNKLSDNVIDTSLFMLSRMN